MAMALVWHGRKRQQDNSFIAISNRHEKGPRVNRLLPDSYSAINGSTIACEPKRRGPGDP